jgi:hypothetical protein
MINKKHLEKALSLGSVSVRVYTTTIRGTTIKEDFSFHFFNADDNEICYYIKDLEDIVDMVVFDTPRIWSDEFKNNKNYYLIKLT